jgi:hypothetical protein
VSALEGLEIGTTGEALGDKGGISGDEGVAQIINPREG